MDTWSGQSHLKFTMINATTNAYEAILKNKLAITSSIQEQELKPPHVSMVPTSIDACSRIFDHQSPLACKHSTKNAI